MGGMQIVIRLFPTQPLPAIGPMNQTSVKYPEITVDPPAQSAESGPAAVSTPRNLLRFPGAPLAIAAILFLYVLVPRVRENQGLMWSFVGAGSTLVIWTLMLLESARRQVHGFAIEWTRPLKSHYIQSTVQLCIYLYWGWYWDGVYAEAPLIVGQLVFLYGFEALLSWSRGRAWRLGFGPLPIILSTNVFLWFKDDAYIFQFLIIATSAVAKEFIRWNRDGRSTHIFNPSSFGLALFSIVLIATGRSDDTWVGKIADTFTRPPHIYLEIFLLGLVVQYFFSVTLMTLAAACTLISMGLVYYWYTGTYYFIFTNIPAPVFLGFHLLMTDPATSPRTSIGKFIFGALYGILTFITYGILESYGSLTVYDKLLPVPLINLSVRGIDWIARGGLLSRLSEWTLSISPKALNLAHMGVWIAIFSWMLATGFIEGPQEGSDDKFWRKVVAESRPGAEHGLIEVLKWQTRVGSTSAWNELGGYYLQGKYLPKDPLSAARCFGQASKLGSLAGSANLVHQFLAVEGAKPGKAVLSALDHLERECANGADGPIYNLLGCAYEIGKGRPRDPAHARELFKKGCALGDKDSCKGVRRIP